MKISEKLFQNKRCWLAPSMRHMPNCSKAFVECWIHSVPHKPSSQFKTTNRSYYLTVYFPSHAICIESKVQTFNRQIKVYTMFISSIAFLLIYFSIYMFFVIFVFFFKYFLSIWNLLKQYFWFDWMENDDVKCSF